MECQALHHWRVHHFGRWFLWSDYLRNDPPAKVLHQRSHTYFKISHEMVLQVCNTVTSFGVFESSVISCGWILACTCKEMTVQILCRMAILETVWYCKWPLFWLLAIHCPWSRWAVWLDSSPNHAVSRMRLEMVWLFLVTEETLLIARNWCLKYKDVLNRFTKLWIICKTSKLFYIDQNSLTKLWIFLPSINYLKLPLLTPHQNHRANLFQLKDMIAILISC